MSDLPTPSVTAERILKEIVAAFIAEEREARVENVASRLDCFDIAYADEVMAEMAKLVLIDDE